MKKILTEAGELRSKKILLRLDLNVPIEENVIQDDTRIKHSLKTLEYLKNAGAKVIILSHIGSDGEKSLEPVAKYMGIKLIDMNIGEIDNCFKNMKEGEVFIAENIRRELGEKTNDSEFSRELSLTADIFVNEAFSASHREHASIVGLPKHLSSFFGFLFEEEVNNLSTAFLPDHPFLFILGGAKFSTKLPLVNKFLNIADKIFIGGALANSLLKEQGYEIGISKSDDDNTGFADILKEEKITLPEDVVVLNGEVKKVSEVGNLDCIVDFGTETLLKLKKMISESKFILWNGPVGFFEKGFNENNENVAKMIVSTTSRSMVGGGDTIACLKSSGVLEGFTFVSTGGGAMLDYLANGTLPGIDAIMKI